MKKLLYQGFLVGACLIALSACTVQVGGLTGGPRSVGVSQCNHIRDLGARASCKQDVAERTFEKFGLGQACLISKDRQRIIPSIADNMDVVPKC